MNNKVLNFLLVIALILTGVNLYWTYTISKQVNPSPVAAIGNNGSNDTNNNAPAQKVELSVGNSPVEGKADAPVTIIEFSDFQCPYCGKFITDSYPQIKSQYIDTGKVKLIFRNFPLPFHQYAQKAAEATLCASQQSKYWEMHDKLFANQNALTVDNLKQYAKDFGLDGTKFNTCLDSSTFADQVKKDLNDGASYGIGGTPSFFVIKGKTSVDPKDITTKSQANQYIIDLGNNETLLIGAQPLNLFQQAIDKALSAN